MPDTRSDNTGHALGAIVGRLFGSEASSVIPASLASPESFLSVAFLEKKDPGQAGMTVFGHPYI
jgi:hypothetical protein